MMGEIANRNQPSLQKENAVVSGGKIMKKGGGSRGATKKVAPTHPTYQKMLKSAISALKEKKGSSKAAILKYVLENYQVGNSGLTLVNFHLKVAMNRGVKEGELKQVKGHGLTGSFRLTDSGKRSLLSPKKRSPNKKGADGKQTVGSRVAKKVVPKNKTKTTAEGKGKTPGKKAVDAKKAKVGSEVAKKVVPKKKTKTTAEGKGKTPGKKAVDAKKPKAPVAKKAKPSMKKTLPKKVAKKTEKMAPKKN